MNIQNLVFRQIEMAAAGKSMGLSEASACKLYAAQATMDVCLECGAPLSEGTSCRDHFNALLLLEWQIPGGPGALAHFYAVATYGLQHPDSMNYTEDTLAGLKTAVVDALDGRVTLAELRLRTRHTADGARHDNRNAQ